MRYINKISIHCSATTAGNAIAFDKYHRLNNHWSSIGYHYIILNGNCGNGYEELFDGVIEHGRSIKITPASVKGYNSGMIGICLVGNGNFTISQYKSLFYLLKYLIKRYNIKQHNIKGHRDYSNVNKKCPCFNAIKFIEFVYLYDNFNTISNKLKEVSDDY